MKLCLDCCWSHRRWSGPLECHHPEVGVRPTDIDPVTGNERGGGFWVCEVPRASYHVGPGECGAEGRRWEPREEASNFHDEPPFDRLSMFLASLVVSLALVGGAAAVSYFMR